MFIRSVSWNQWNMEVGAFYKKLTAYSRKQFCKKFHLWCFKGPWIIATLTLMNPAPPTINAPPSSIDLMQIIPSLITSSLHPKIKLRRIKIYKTGFRKLSVLSKLWEWRIWQEVGIILFASLWCIAYGNLYMTRLLKSQKSYFKFI